MAGTDDDIDTGETRVTDGSGMYMFGAEADYTEALRLNPRHLDAMANRGISRERLGNRAGALQDYERVLGLAPANWRRRGSITGMFNRLKGR